MVKKSQNRKGLLLFRLLGKGRSPAWCAVFPPHPGGAHAFTPFLLSNSEGDPMTSRLVLSDPLLETQVAALVTNRTPAVLVSFISLHSP